MADDRIAAALSAIEPLAHDAECSDPSDVIRFSIAISLKRIADQLSYSSSGVGMRENIFDLLTDIAVEMREPRK